MTTHPQVVIATPHRDGLSIGQGILRTKLSVTLGMREGLGSPVDLLEDTVGMISLLLVNLPLEVLVIVKGAIIWRRHREER